MKMSQQQEAALKHVGDWLKHGHSPIFRLFGYAGTGKTTIAQYLDAYCVYAAYTGKAALMLRKKSCVGASTIHGLIYKPISQKDGTIDFILDRETSPAAACDLIVIDECSMVDNQLAKDLLSFKKPILVLGDPAQLPPVAGTGFFINEKPDFMLTEIHRQAKDDPIIHLATRVREGHKLELGNYGESRVIQRKKVTEQEVLSHDQLIVGLNKTRVGSNMKIRKLKNLDPKEPVVGDKLVCLRNNRQKGLYNGGIFTISRKTPTTDARSYYKFVIDNDDFEDAASQHINAVKSIFAGENPQKLDYRKTKHLDIFDYGYALTCHKSQGSQWDSVLTLDESGIFEQPEKWLYTAITRAATKLTVAID